MFTGRRSAGLFVLVVLAGVWCVIGLATVAAGQSDSFRFVAVGDSRGSNNGINAAIVAELATAIEAEAPELVIFPGDLVTDGTQVQLENWVSTFMQPLQNAGIAVYPCRGNHESYSSVTVWRTVFSGAYELPGNGPAGEEKLTYSVEHRNALFIALEEFQAPSNYRVNQVWLDQQLAANTRPHVFVFGHLPAFAVYHADCLDDNPADRGAFWNSLGEAGARVYFCGHDHFFDHARVQDSAGNWIHQYIAGAGGAPFHHWSGSYADSSVEGIAHSEDYGYAVVDVNNLDVTITYKDRGAPGVYEAFDVYSYASPLGPDAGFSASPLAAEVGETVQFTDESSPGAAPITERLWDFGDGTTSTERNPPHDYSHNGWFGVSLTVTNQYGSDVIEKGNLVGVGLPVLAIPGVLVLSGIIVAAFARGRYRGRGKQGA